MTTYILDTADEIASTAARTVLAMADQLAAAADLITGASVETSGAPLPAEHRAVAYTELASELRALVKAKTGLTDITVLKAQPKESEPETPFEVPSVTPVFGTRGPGLLDF